jgi:lactoylglutathione lyase
MRNARAIADELIDRLAGGDQAALDDLVAVDMVNHAAGPQGREGLKQILATIEVDLGPTTVERQLTIAEGDLVTTQLTVHGTHRASTMPLLTGVPVSGKAVAWQFVHLWRVSQGQIVEHWACRDDVGLLAQVGAWPPPAR